MSETGQAIATHDLVKVYGEKSRTPVRALDGLAIQVSKGEIFGLLGRNGAGKTTLLRILTTLIRPTSGSASVMGWDVARDPLQVRKQICAVLQENAVEVYLSVADNLNTYARFHSVPLPEIRRRSDRVLDQFGLGEYRHQKVIDLSGGLKRRVQVAKVFMVDRPVVFLDEATTGMDPINKRATIDAIRGEAQQGRTIVLTTHILSEAEELCDTIAIIDRGTCLVSGDLQTIKALSSRAFDMTITFDSLTERILTELQQLPLLKMTYKLDTVELCVKGKELTAIEVLNRLSHKYTITQFEVSGATLEEVFLELLAHREGGTP